MRGRMLLFATFALAACAGHGERSKIPADATDVVDPNARQILACRIHMQFTSSVGPFLQSFAAPQPLAGVAGNAAALAALLEDAETAFNRTSPAATANYRKALLRAREVLRQKEAEISDMPDDVVLAAKHVATSREAARAFAKSRSDGTDVILKAAEADLGFRDLDGKRAEEVAARLEDAAKLRPGVAPLVSYANALRELTRTGSNWAALQPSERLEAALGDLARAAGAFGATCRTDGAAVFEGTASARPADLRKRAIIISNIPTKTCVESAKKIFPSLPADGMSGHGTGFVVYRDGEPLLLTNRHVVAGAGALEAKHADGAPMPPVHLLHVSTEHDIAVLAFEKRDAAIGDGIPFANADPAELEPVIAAGFPGLFGRASFQVTRGAISNAKVLLPDGGRDLIFLQHTAIVDPGSSGGPLVNEKGELVGVNARKATDREAVSFAIPGSIVRSIVAGVGPRLGQRSARTACLLAIDALHRGPEFLEVLASPDLRTRAPVTKGAAIEAMHHGNASPCEVMKSAAIAAEFAELATAGKPGTLELCGSLRAKEAAVIATIPLARGTASFEFRAESRDDDGFRVTAFRVESKR